MNLSIILILCYLSTFIIGFINSCGSAKFQYIKPDSKNAYNFYAIITAVISILNFSILCGFSPVISNFKVLILAFIYSISCCMSYRFNMISLEKNGVFLTTISSQIGTIVLPIIVSLLFLKENINLSTIISAVFVILSSAVLAFGKHVSKFNFPILCINILICAVSTICTKIFVKIDSAENIVSFYWLINVIILVISVILFFAKSDKSSFKTELKHFKLKHYLLVILISTASNFGGYISKFTLLHVEVITNTIITTSLGLVTTAIVSYIFGEKLRLRHLISVIFALIATILPLIFV